MNEEKKRAQIEKTFQAFREKPKTMLEVASETGIMRASICRYVAKLKKQDKITEVRKGKCPISSHKATFYSTDPKHFPKETQPELFPQKTKSRAYQL